MNSRCPAQFFTAALLAAAMLVSSVVAAQVCATPGRDSAVATLAGIINSYCPVGTGAVASCSVSFDLNCSVTATGLS